MDITINYFRNELRTKLPRAICGRFLPLWDDIVWIKRQTDINLHYIKANDFLVFLYQTKKDICCHNDINAQCLSNAIDKFFFLMFDFQSYFTALIETKKCNNQPEIVKDILKYKKTCIIPTKLISVLKQMELFVDLSKKVTEWDYWRKQVILNFVKIVLGNNFKTIEKDDLENLEKLINHIEDLFYRGINY